MARMYDQAHSGDPAAYNQAVAQYNAWIASLLGQNGSLMLKPIARSTPALFSYGRTFQPIHEIDASWNQTQLVPQPNAYGLVPRTACRDLQLLGAWLDHI